MAGELALPTLVQRYRFDSSGARQGVTQVQGQTKDLVQSVGGIKTAAQGAFKAFLAFEGVRVLKDVIGDAVKTGQAVRTTGQLFGQSSKEIVDWAETTDRSLGLSKQATLGMADGVGTLLKGFGLASPAAADMSRNLIKIAVDVGTFKNQDPARVMVAFQRALSGASKGLRAYGIDTSTARQQEIALSLGISGTAKEWTSAQKAAVFYQLILKGTAQEAGTFANRSGDLVVMQKKLTAEFTNAKDEIGTALLPVVTQLFSVFSAGFNAIGPSGVKMVAQVGAIGAAAAAALAGASALGQVFGSVADAFTSTDVTATQVVLQVDEITTAMGPAADAAKVTAGANLAVAASNDVVAASAAAAAGGVAAEGVAAQGAAGSTAELGIAADGAAGGLGAEAIAAEASAGANVAAGTAATTAGGGFQLMSLKAAGAIPIYTALAVATFELVKTLGDLFAIGTKASVNVEHSAQQMAHSLLGSVSTAGQAKVALGGMTDATQKWLDTLRSGGEQVLGGMLGPGGALKTLGVTYQDITNVVQDGKPAIDAWVGSLHLSEVNAGTLRHGLEGLTDAWNAEAEQTARNIVSKGGLTRALFDTAVQLSTTAKEGTNWLEVLRIISGGQDAIKGTGDALLGTLEAQRVKWNALTTAIIANTDRLRDNRDGLLGIQAGAISAEQNLFRIADAQKTYTEAVKAHGVHSREAIEAGLAYQALTNQQIVSVDGVARNTEKWAADSTGLTAALKAQADAMKKGDQDAIAAANDKVAEKTDLMRKAVERAAATTSGPVHDALVQWLSDTANLVHGATEQAHAVELNIKKSSGLSDALANQAFILKIVGKDSDAYAAATATVTEKQKLFRAALMDAANHAAGPVREKILEYIRTIDAINEKKVTQVAIAGLPVALQGVARYLVHLGFIPPGKITKVTVDAEAALHKLGLLKLAIETLHPNVSLTAVLRADAYGRAGGGPVAAGHTYPIGELGPEELTLYPGGGGIITSHAAIAARGPVAASAVSSIPGQVSTNISVTGLPAATMRVLEHSGAVYSIPGYRTTQIAATGVAAAVQALHGYTVAVEAVPAGWATELTTPGLDVSVARLGGYRRTIDSLPSEVAVTGTADARAQLLDYTDILAAVPEKRSTEITTEGLAAAAETLRAYSAAADTVPRERSTDFRLPGIDTSLRQLAVYRTGIEQIPDVKATRLTTPGAQDAALAAARQHEALRSLAANVVVGASDLTRSLVPAGARAAGATIVEQSYTYDVDVHPQEHTLTNQGLLDHLAHLERHGTIDTQTGVPREIT